MRKVYINRRPVEGPWGGGNLMVRALQEHLPKFGYKIVPGFVEEPDVVFLMDPRREHEGGVGIEEAVWLKQQRPHAKIVHRINECDSRKGTIGVDMMLFEAQREADRVVFVSKWLQEHLRDEWYGNPLRPFGQNERVIYNGVDSNHFSPKREAKFILNSQVAAEISIVAHHWSDNPMKGADVYKWIDEVFIPRHRVGGYTFTYIGRIGFQLKNSKLIAPIFGAELGRELAKGIAYVSGSRFDPGPNHILEALSCGLTTFVHAVGGGAVEFAGRSHAFSNFDELEKMLLTCQTQPKNSAIELSSWEKCVEQYAKMFDEMFEGDS